MTTLRKYLHSCLVVERDGRRLLIDPGTFSFVEGKLQPEDIGPVDSILITHEHPDHCDPAAVKRIVAVKRAPIWTNAGVAAVLEQSGMSCEIIPAGEKRDCAGFSVSAIAAPHGPIPFPEPENVAYLIDGRILTPGDSLELADVPKNLDVLALPVAGPWLTVVASLAFAKQAKPKIVVPIHDAIIKDFFLPRIYLMCEETLKPLGIAFHPLQPGDGITIE